MGQDHSFPDAAPSSTAGICTYASTPALFGNPGLDGSPALTDCLHFMAASKRLLTSFQLTTFHQLVA